ncbi:MAG: patatin-like phospholipase family protein [Vicinamibacterales bacterium]
MTGPEPLLLYGSTPEVVIAAILQRSARRQAGDRRPDGRKLGLVIEGGALRGVASAGGAVVLAQLGFSDLFDEVYATSAAVMNASYFISNQPLLGISVYFDNCTTRQFVNPWRFWKIVDVDYIFDDVAVHEKPLDVARVAASSSRLQVAVIDRRTGDAFMVDARSHGIPMLRILKASAAIPILYNRTVDIGGRPCMDGGLAIPFGLKHAISDGCTDVLVLSTRPPDHASKKPNWLHRLLFNVLCARGRSAVNRVFAERHLRSRELRDLSTGRTPPPAGVSIATICAEADENIERLTRDRQKLHSAAVSYGRKVLRVFGKNPATWTLPEDCAVAARADTNTEAVSAG